MRFYEKEYLSLNLLKDVEQLAYLNNMRVRTHQKPSVLDVEVLNNNGLAIGFVSLRVDRTEALEDEDRYWLTSSCTMCCETLPDGTSPWVVFRAVPRDIRLSGREGRPHDIDRFCEFIAWSAITFILSQPNLWRGRTMQDVAALRALRKLSAHHLHITDLEQPLDGESFRIIEFLKLLPQLRVIEDAF